MHDTVLSCLAVEAVADVIDNQSRLHGQGPVLAGLVWPGFPPGPEWLASTEVVEVMVGLLRDTTGDELAHAVNAALHDRGCSCGLNPPVSSSDLAM